MSSSEENIFIEKLKIELEKMQKCQQEKGLKSCLKCEKIMECEIRNIYVQRVYESMSKGEVGGFEF